MKVLYDLNVLMDVMQRREPFYEASAAVLSKALEGGECEGVIPGHAVTTLHYLLSRYVNKQTADESVDFLIDHFGFISAVVTVLVGLASTSSLIKDSNLFPRVLDGSIIINSIYLSVGISILAVIIVIMISTFKKSK